ncbi:hypothetical protein [Granulicoccus phenolivorans]|uniref:hypothetical protein n=1 Tax=Granulicoccus phenolivorans TaxID=266854 RepID=UPI00047AE9FB|nr:hypothetical protein [Granulicoccus phenolivorans]
MSAGTVAPTPGGRAALQQVAASGTDIYEVTARLESSGVSRGVAAAHGYESVFDFAHTITEQVPAEEMQASRQRHSGRNRVSLRASLIRMVVMLCGVILCATSLPQASEMAVFLMAASGWIVGQAVSASAWYAWGAGRRRDGMAAAGVVGLVLLVVSAIAAAVSGLPGLLVWVGVGAATPILLLLANGAVLVVAGVATAAICGISWFARNHYAWAPSALAPVGIPLAYAITAVAVLVAAVLLVREVRGARPRYVRGGARALIVALLQVLFQLVVLLQIFLGVGASEFGAVALAVMAAGALTDPLLTVQAMWTHRVSQRSDSWRRGRFQIGLLGVVIVVIVLVITAAAVLIVLSDPYRITLNEPAIVAAAVLCSAVICGTNILLRTGSRLSAMLFAALAELLVAITLFFPADEPSGFYAMAAMAALISLLALLVAAARFGHPTAW